MNSHKLKFSSVFFIMLIAPSIAFSDSRAGWTAGAVEAIKGAVNSTIQKSAQSIGKGVSEASKGIGAGVNAGAGGNVNADIKQTMVLKNSGVISQADGNGSKSDVVGNSNSGIEGGRVEQTLIAEDSAMVSKASNGGQATITLQRSGRY